MASIHLNHLGKTYPDGTQAVKDFNLHIEDGELMVLVGPSGCGKTTILRMVAGLEEITAGEILIGETVANNLEPRARDVAMVFQNYALYPHMTVFENIAFPLESQHLPKRQIKDQVERTATLLGLEGLLKRRPRNLSGGQRQRVAMGRAIIRQPQVFVMDEPLSNLDAKLRVQMRAEIAKLQRDLRVTTLYVTHDQVEAMTMGDRVAVMHKGVLQEEGKPQAIYDDPANLFVATFIGSPATNLFEGVVERDDLGNLSCRIGDQRLELPTTPERSELRRFVNRTVAVGVRPEHLMHTSDADPSWPRLRGEVSYVESLGFEQLVHMHIAATPVLSEDILDVARDLDAAAAEDLEKSAAAQRVTAIARFESGSHVLVDRPLELAVRPDKILFFDLGTGSAIQRNAPDTVVANHRTSASETP